MYGKINIDGSFDKAPNVLKYKSRTYINPPETILLDLGYLPVKEEGKPTKHIEDYTATYKIERNVIIATYRKKESSSVVISGGDGDALIPVELLATKEKVIYQQDEPISIDDLEVVCYYQDGTNGVVTNYTTNITDIDSSFAGYKPLEITYIHNSVTVKTTVGIVVNNTDSYNSTQLAYKITKAGILTHDMEVVSTTEKLRTYGKFKMRIKARIVVEQNDNSTYTNIGFGENSVWGTNLIGATKLVLKPKQVGEFIINANMDVFEYDKPNVDADKTILRLYNNGKKKVQGYFEILDMSLTYVEPVPKVPVDIAASKTQSRAIIGEEMVTDDITVAVLYNDDTSATVTENAVITFPQTINVGNNEITVEYSESNHTVSTTINVYYYKANKTEPDEFHDMTAWEWCRSWEKGINWGNELDSSKYDPQKITFGDYSKLTGDSTHEGDSYMNQETAWGQPVATLKNFEDIKAKGFDCVRIPVTWCYNSYTEPEPDADGYHIRHIGKFWACRVREVVDMALEAGLKVLINMHHEMLIIYTNSGNTHEKNQVYRDAYNMWLEIADVFKYYDERLAFEGYNEVDNVKSSFNFAAKAAEEMNELNQLFVNAVRSTGGNNTHRVLHCPTTVHMASESALKAWVCPTDTVENHIVLNVHRYAKNFLQDLEFNFTTLENYSNLYNVPICIGEWGTETKDGDYGWRAIHAQNYMARARYHNLFPIYWDNGSNYEIVKKYNRVKEYNHPFESLQLIIDGIMKGYDEMKAYCIPDNQIKVFDKLDDFTLLWWSAAKGYYNSFWGSATTYIFPVEGGKRFIITADREGKAVDETAFPAYVIWLAGSMGDDGEMQYSELSKVEFSWHSDNRSGIIPEEATHAIILSNSSDKNIKDWDKIIADGEYKINFMEYSNDDITEETLHFRTPTRLICTKGTTEYLTLGTEVDTNDIVVQVEYNDGFKKFVNIEDCTIDASNVNINANGSYYITVSTTVEGVALTAQIEIIMGVLLKSIYTHSTLACKLGGSLADIDMNGLVVMGVYSDNSETQILNGYTVDTSNIDFNTENTYDVTITYTEGDITRTCTTYCIVYTSLYVEGVKILDKDSITYGDMVSYGYESATPNAIKYTCLQKYMYHYIVTDAPVAYSTLLSVEDGQLGDFPIYIYSGYYTDFATSASSKAIEKVGSKLSTIQFSPVYDSEGRGWYKILCKANYYDGSVHATIEKSMIPIMHIDSEADLASIEVEENTNGD